MYIVLELHQFFAVPSRGSHVLTARDGTPFALTHLAEFLGWYRLTIKTQLDGFTEEANIVVY